MVNDILSEALKEAYTNAPSDVIILHTLEIIHPSFVGENGSRGTIRIVRDYQNLKATLEDNAPMDGGKEVEFISYGFDLSLPDITDSSVPEVVVTVDNTDKLIIENIEKAIETQIIISVIYRPYLSNDTKAPHYNPPLYLTLTDIKVNSHRITGRGRFSDLSNRSFPNAIYNINLFPGLIN